MCSTPRRRSNFLSQFSSVRNQGSEMDPIDMINKLQNKLASKGGLLGVPLPQIVVQGAQSSGKSSVLESIVGRDFLPRGTGTVTRRPTVVQLQPSDEVYAEFLHRGDEKFTDFELVKQEIKNETLRDPGPNGFSSKPITLKIYAPNVLKLTLVDMPGLIRNVTPDMPTGSTEDVEAMVLRYIGQPNSIILAVSPANQDIATSDAIEIAQRVDPKRERTLCVLTKLDIMDRGTDARDILENRVLPLAKGYIGVVSRSQDDINTGKDFQSSLLSEKRFFENHPAYSDIADKHGSSYLQKRLHFELIEHIRKTLPSVRRDLSHKLSCLRKDVKKMDQMLGLNNEGGTGAQMFMQRLVQQFIDDIDTNLFGHNEYVSVSSLTSGVIINYKMQIEMQEILKLPTELAEDEAMSIIANEHGSRNILSVPSVGLEAACSYVLERYRDQLETFVDSISSVLFSAVENSSIIVSDHPILKENLVRFINESIDRASVKTKDILGMYLDAQMKFSNVYHWDFNKSKLEGGLPCSPVIVWDSHADENVNEDKGCHSGAHGNVDENNGMSANAHTDDLNSLSAMISGKMKLNQNMQASAKNFMNIVKEYMLLVQKQIADMTLKFTNCFLVRQVFDFIKAELMIKLLNSSTKESIVEELEKVFKRRNELLELCSDLEEALIAIQSF